MSISAFDIFKIGIGPSSSHTVGPMKAAYTFLEYLIDSKLLKKVTSLRCEFYGSLAMTGKGHGTDSAILLGLLGLTPENIDSDKIPDYLEEIKKKKSILLNQEHKIEFKPKDHLKFCRRITMPKHPNALSLCVYDKDNNELAYKLFYSIGGGFIAEDSEFEELRNEINTISELPYPFKTGKDLLIIGKENNINISDIMMANECVSKSKQEVEKELLSIWEVMQKCLKRGLKNEGVLPGGLKVKRRAPQLYQSLAGHPEKNLRDPLSIMDWITLYALAINEENAAQGQVVTAPTNGAAGVIPAVLMYYTNFCTQANDEGIVRFLLTSAAIGGLYKINASISGAEVGCQGEVGVACSMAAGALCEVLGGTIEQVENAAEIAMEHNLGLTCDPIGGLVQIPCIERNAMAAIKAINAARMSLRNNGEHFVSLDKVIKTMLQTGKDMKKHYKETARGGLAVNIPEC